MLKAERIPPQSLIDTIGALEYLGEGHYATKEEFLNFFGSENEVPEELQEVPWLFQERFVTMV